MTCSSSVTWKFLWIVFSTIFMKPPLLLRPEHLWTQLRVCMSWRCRTGSRKSKAAFWVKICILYLSESQKKAAIALALLSGCHTQVCHRLHCSRAGTEPLAMLLGKAETRCCTLEYLVVPCCTLLCLAVTAPVTAPGLGCSLFIGKGERCSDAQQGDLCFRIYYISGRGGEEEKGRKRERRERFLAFQKRNQRHLAVISAEVHQISDRVCLTKKSRRVNGVTVSWACADRNSPRARPRTETRGQRLGSIQGPD